MHASARSLRSHRSKIRSDFDDAITSDRYCGVSSIAQKPAIHMLGSCPFAGGQQSASIVQRSFVFEQRICSSSQVPMGSANSTCGSFTKQNPPQQSVPEVQLPPVFLQGSRAANARWLPVPNSWPGNPADFQAESPGALPSLSDVAPPLPAARAPPTGAPVHHRTSTPRAGLQPRAQRAESTSFPSNAGCSRVLCGFGGQIQSKAVSATICSDLRRIRCSRRRRC